MDFFLVDSTPFQWFSIHTCIPSLLKTSLFCFFLFFQDGEGVGAKGLCDVVCNPEEPLALPPPKSGLLSFVNFSSCWHPFKTGRRGKARGAPGREWTQSVMADTAGTSWQPISSLKIYGSQWVLRKPKAQLSLPCKTSGGQISAHFKLLSVLTQPHHPRRVRVGEETPHLLTYKSISAFLRKMSQTLC